ncbi:transposase [Streptomyces sp. NPDC101152]|uniref:transposase n=1 Tax=Streptomyces sp. NPDC101152 TaxID=3366116 RepID=UPI00381E50D2
MLFTPRYGRGPFTDKILRRCEEVMHDGGTDLRREAAGVQRRPRSRAPARALPAQGRHSRRVGSLTGVSAQRLRPEVPAPIRKYRWGEHFWSPSYLAASWPGRPARRHQGAHREPETSRLRSTAQTRAPTRVTAASRSASSRA